MRERLLRESELTLPKAISVSHAAEETRKHAHEILKSNETIHQHKISKHSNSRSQTSAQGTEIIKTASFAKTLTTVVNVKFNRKNLVKKCCPRNRKTLHDTEQTEIESPSADKYDFFLDTTNLKKKPVKIWLTFLKSEMNFPDGILLYFLMVFQYPITWILVLNVMLSPLKI